VSWAGPNLTDKNYVATRKPYGVGAPKVKPETENGTHHLAAVTGKRTKAVLRLAPLTYFSSQTALDVLGAVFLLSTKIYAI
jgi:hypothetical protein